MKVFGKIESNSNALFPKRFLAYFVDITIAGFIKLFILQFMFMNRSGKIFADFIDGFSNLFPDLKVNEFKGIHIRYITSDAVYKEIFLILIMLLVVSFLYRLISYVFFKVTLGQKLFGIRVVDNVDSENNKKINLLQAVFRSVLEFLPSATMFVVAFLIPFNMLSFDRYTVTTSGIVGVFTNLIKYCNVDTLFLVIFVYILFWFNIYFFSNRFFLHDIITRTKVIDKNKINISSDESTEKKIVDGIDSSFSVLNKIRKYCFNLIEKVVNKIFRKCKKS